MAALRLQGAGEMLAVAAEGRGGKIELPGQGSLGHRLPEAAVDLRGGGAVADGTAFYHPCAPRQEFRTRADGFQAIKGGDGGPERAGQLAGK